MNTILSILALSLLAVLAWIAGYAASLTLLRYSLWSPRLHLEDRFPPATYRRINRSIAFVAGLIAAAVTVYLCGPPTIQRF